MDTKALLGGNMDIMPDKSVEGFVFEREIEKSGKTLNELINDCTDMVQNVQIANDVRDIRRSAEERILTEKRSEYIAAENVKHDQMMEIINSKWESIKMLNDCLELHNAFENQKEMYSNVMEKKDKIIHELDRELEDADRKFIRNQDTHKEDVNIITRRINEHIDIMRKAYRKHLQLLENISECEEKSLLHAKQEDWKTLNGELEDKKVEKTGAVFKSVHEYEVETMNMIWDHYEKYRSMKKRLELDLQALHIKLQETKTFCMLEERKLEYNYLVLTKRQKELVKIKARQRRKINSLRAELSNLQNERLEAVKIQANRKDQLEHELLKLSKERKILLTKISHSEEVNVRTFNQIWNLNEKRVIHLLEKILEMDKQLNEYVLQISWKAPSFQKIIINQLPVIQSNSVEQKDDHFQDEKTTAKLITDSHVMKFILQNIVSCLKFMIDKNVDFIMKDMKDEEKTLVQLDNILKILDIRTDTELESLMEHFVPFINCKTCQENQTPPIAPYLKYKQALQIHNRTGSGFKSRKKQVYFKRPLSVSSLENRTNIQIKRNIRCEISSHSWNISESSVIKAISNFMKNKKQKKCKVASQKKVNQLLQSVSSADIEQYWFSFKSKYITELENFWYILNEPLQDYLVLLQEQNTLHDEISNLKKQNVELRKTLSLFMENDNHTVYNTK